MKKEDLLGTFIYLLILGLGAIYIFVVLGPRAPASGFGDLYFVFNLCSLIAGAIFNAILFEVAHVLGAKIGGYKPIFVSILGLTFKNEKNKWKFCFNGFDGLTGETRITPNKEDLTKCNPYPFLLGGTVFYLIELTFVLIFFFATKDDPGDISNVAYFLLNMLIVGSMLLVYNIIPTKLDCVTDGYYLSLIANPRNKEPFNELLKVNYELSLGNNVEIKVFDDITNFTADLNMNKVAFLIAENKNEEALTILENIVNHKEKITYDVYLKAKSEIIFIKFMSLSEEEIVQFYEKEVTITERRDIANNNNISCVKAYLLMSGLADKSRSESVVSLNKAPKVLKKVPEKLKVIEKNLLNSALKKVCEAHEKWELDKYILK